MGTVLGRYRGTAWPGCPGRIAFHRGVRAERRDESAPNSLLAIQLNPDRDGLADRSLMQSKGMNVRRRGAFCEGLTLYAELDDLEAPICYGKLIISRA